MPTALPSPLPSPLPTTLPSSLPTVMPSPMPTALPSPLPSPLPTTRPSLPPTSAPTVGPTFGENPRNRKRTSDGPYKDRKVCCNQRGTCPITQIAAMSARNDYAAWTAAEFDKAFPNRSNPDESLVWLTISDVRTEDLTTGANNWLTRFPDAAVVKPDGPEFFRASGTIDAMQNKLFGKYYPEDIYGTLAEVGDIVAADSAYDDLGTWCAFCGNDEVPCTCSGTAYGADCKNQHDLLMNAWLGFGLWIFCCILCYVIFGRGYLAGIAIGVASRLTRSAHATSAKYVKLQYPSDTTENKVFQIVIGHPVVGVDGKPVIKDGLYAPVPRLPNTLLVTAPKNAAGKFFRQPVTWDGRAMPSETPLEDVPPNLADAPTQREVYRAMRSQYVKRCVLAPIMLIFLMLNDIVKIASTICLLLRSMQAIIPWIDIDFDIELRFDEIFSLMYECAVAVSESLAPVADAFVQIFKWFFFALDLSNILDMFTIGINVTCEGSQQPWYLLGNLMIVTAIVLMASADLADPMRFKKMWYTFISQRRMVFSYNNIGEVFSAALDFFQNSVMYEKAELVFAYMLQTLCTLVSTRCGALRIKDDGSFDFFYTAACNVQETDNTPHMEKFVSVAVFLISWLVLPPFLVLILSSFAHSIGPAPPITREHLIAMRVQHEERLNRPKPKTCQQRLCGKKNEDETDGADSEMPAEQGGAPPKVEDEEVGVELSVADADKGETKVEEEGETSRDSTAHQFKEFIHDDVLEEQRLFWPNRFGDYRARLESQHEVLSRDGFIRASINESSWRHVYRVTVWKLWQLVKLSCGVWDRDAFLATRILPRADILIRHDLTDPEERHPKGLQLHQDLISGTGRMVATFFCLLPAGAFLSKTSEAVNASPLFVTDKAVDRDGHAVWESKIDGDDGKARTRGVHAFGRMWPPLRPVAQGNDAIIVLNASFRYRLFGFVLAVVQMLLIFIVCFKPTIQTVAAMLIWMLICEVKVIVLEDEDQQFYRRRTEWYRRYFEALRGGHHGTSLWIAGHETKLSSSGGAPHLLNNAPLPHEAFPSGTENRLIMSIPPHGGGSRPLRNADALRGHWVLMDRGSITFSEKARKAHAAGAVGLVLINNDMQAPDAIPQMSGDTGGEVKIPILGISYNAGRRAKKLAVHGADQGAKIELVIDDQKHAKGLRKAEGGDEHAILELLGLKAPKVPEEEPETPGSGVDDTAMAAGAQERLAKLRTQFEAMDVNQNGFIGVAEFKTSLSKFADETGEGETPSDEMVQAMVTEADINKDGAR